MFFFLWRIYQGSGAGTGGDGGDMSLPGMKVGGQAIVLSPPTFSMEYRPAGSAQLNKHTY